MMQAVARCRTCLLRLLVTTLALEEVINDRVEEHTADRDSRADLLLVRKDLAGDGGHVDHDNHALRCVGD